MIKHLVCLSTALAFIMFAGCNDEAAKGRVPVYKTTGQVKFVGSPVIGAIVTFAPQDKNQRAAVGRTNDDGEFTLTTYGANDGAAAGEYKVMIMLPDSGGSEPEPQAAHSPNDGRNFGGSHSAQSAKPSKGGLLPAIYADVEKTPLSAKVEPNGANRFTFELK